MKDIEIEVIDKVETWIMKFEYVESCCWWLVRGMVESERITQETYRCWQLVRDLKSEIAAEYRWWTNAKNAKHATYFIRAYYVPALALIKKRMARINGHTKSVEMYRILSNAKRDFEQHISLDVWLHTKKILCELKLVSN